MSTTRENPFPGMNPYMEERWTDIHARMITSVAARIQKQLPPDLVTEVEQDLKVGSAPEDSRYRPDVAVREPWTEGSGGAAILAPPVQVAKPIIVPLPRPHKRIAIADERGHLITVVEVLSPSNKLNGGMQRYISKRDDFIDANVNLVEIDLVRVGGLITDLFEGATLTRTMGDAAPAHVIMVCRGHGFDDRALYPIRYQDRLPAFEVPLRLNEPPVVLDMQSTIEQCFEEAGMWHASYRKDPAPPLSAEDTVWLDGLLKSKGLR